MDFLSRFVPLRSDRELKRREGHALLELFLIRQ